MSSGFALDVPAPFDLLRLEFNRWSASASAIFGVPGFFKPRFPSPLLTPSGSPGALSVYDSTPLHGTLRELVDFDLINARKTRLAVGAVELRAGNSVYFDNQDPDLVFGPQHVMASGALPPGLPPIRIKDGVYWDGGLVSNSPLWYVLDDGPRLDALILQVDLFSARGREPRNLDEVLERAKDIQYSSKTRFNTSRAKEEEALREALTHVHREAAAAPAQGSAGRAAGRARARAPDLDRPPDQSPRRVLVAVEGLRVLARDSARAVGRRPG